jgi:hypothetical protein
MNIRKRISEITLRPYFPAAILILANLIVGLLTFQDYGLSWDEPLFYQYAEAVPYAYSIPERLSGNFDLEKAYGPSAEDHKTYGPAYLLPARAIVDLLDWALPVSRSDLWHLVNFFTFQAGVLLLYGISKRWVMPWAAFAAALLFSTQPVLWGHAWINPKDIPFTVFFLAAMYTGLKMVDRLSGLSPVGQPAELPPSSPAEIQARWQKLGRIFQILAVITLVLLLAAYTFSASLQEAIRGMVHQAYQADSHSFLGRIFEWAAVNAATVPEEAYANKAIILFTRLRAVLAALTWVLAIPAGLLTLWLPALKRLAAWLAVVLAPLPRMPAWWVKGLRLGKLLRMTLAAGVLLGALTSIRILGPLAGFLAGLYFLFRHERRPWAGLVIYGAIASLVTYATWPYLWEAPLGNFIKVIQHMSYNPKAPPVLFNGVITSAESLPLLYLPVMLLITLTLPVWPLFIAGLVIAVRRIIHRQIEWRALSAILLWFLIPFGYVLLRRPPMYDGYRHFIFLLPPVFIVSSFTFQAAFERLRKMRVVLPILAVLALPGIMGLIALHPYPYTYYNALVGGTGGAFRRFDTDYWLTCYKETMSHVNEAAPSGTTLFALRQPSIAQAYAAPGITIERFDPDDDRTFPGSLLLLTTRTNADQIYYPNAPEWHRVGRAGAVFCVVKQLP